MWSRKIFMLKEKARLFLEICLLGLIRMDDKQISDLVEQYEAYLDIRMEVRMEYINETLQKNKI